MPDLRIPAVERRAAPGSARRVHRAHVAYQIGTEPLDPLQVNAGAVVLHAAIGAPNPAHILGGGRGWGGLIKGLLHGAGNLSAIAL